MGVTIMTKTGPCRYLYGLSLTCASSVLVCHGCIPFSREDRSHGKYVNRPQRAI